MLKCARVWFISTDSIVRLYLMNEGCLEVLPDGNTLVIDLI